MVTFIILLNLPSFSQETQDTLQRTDEYKTPVDMNTNGNQRLENLISQGCFWTDGKKLSMRSPMDLIPYPIPHTQQKICILNPSQGCLVIEDVYFNFENAIQVSDPIICQQGTPCLVKNNIDINITMEVNSSTPLPLADWMRIFDRFLDIQAPSTISLGKISGMKDATSIFVLWFKPIHLVVVGSYQTSKEDKIVSVDFHAKFPLFNEAKNLIGIAGVKDLCSSQKSINPKQTNFDGLVVIKSFFCKSKK